MDTQSAADLLGCLLSDVITYKKRMKARQEELLIKIMNADEEAGLYDT